MGKAKYIVDLELEKDGTGNEICRVVRVTDSDSGEDLTGVWAPYYYYDAGSEVVEFYTEPNRILNIVVDALCLHLRGNEKTSKINWGLAVNRNGHRIKLAYLNIYEDKERIRREQEWTENPVAIFKKKAVNFHDLP